MTVFGAWSIGAWLSEWLKWVLTLLLAVLVMDIANYRRWEWVLLGITVAGAAHALIGLYIFLGGSGADHLLIAGRFFRAFGTFGQPNPFGGFMGLLAPVALASAWGYGHVLWVMQRNHGPIDRNIVLLAGFYSICGGLMVAALIASWSRGAWLSLAGALTVTMIACRVDGWQSLAWVRVCLLAAT
ncbi:hypothetical protein HC928_16795, partial [bacterium]|nr:hypothetical protein [bacterium]